MIIESIELITLEVDKVEVDVTMNENLYIFLGLKLGDTLDKRNFDLLLLSLITWIGTNISLSTSSSCCCCCSTIHW